MTEEQKEKLIELQRELILSYQEQLKNTGKTMRVLNAIKAIQEFEDSLPCNNES